MKFTRRTAMEVIGASAFTPFAAAPLAAAQVPAAPPEGKDTPKIALLMNDGGGGGRGADPSVGPKRIKQLGVNNVCGGLGGVPWTEESLNNAMA